MLFKTVDGKYVEILRKDFNDDKSYYKKIIEIKGLVRV